LSTQRSRTPVQNCPAEGHTDFAGHCPQLVIPVNRDDCRWTEFMEMKFDA